MHKDKEGAVEVDTVATGEPSETPIQVKGKLNPHWSECSNWTIGKDKLNDFSQEDNVNVELDTAATESMASDQVQVCVRIWLGKIFLLQSWKKHHFTLR